MIHVQGATGPNAAQINGAYKDTGIKVNEKSLYRKAVNASTLWLRYHEDQWLMSTGTGNPTDVIFQSDLARGSEPPPGDKDPMKNPSKPTKWVENMGGAWKVQPKLKVVVSTSPNSPPKSPLCDADPC